MSCRIDAVPTGPSVVLRVSGRIRAKDVETIRNSVANDVVAFDLADVTIVDRDVVSFLASCEAAGVRCERCPEFLREWIDKEKQRLVSHEPVEPVAVVSQFIERVVNGGDLSLIDHLWAADLAWHGGSLGDIHGIDAFKSFMQANAAGAFSEMHLTVDEILSVGSKVVVRFRNSGTQTGTLMGAPPTGKRAQWLGIGIYTVTNNRIVEGWFGEDVLGMLLQLGIVKLSV